MLVFLAPIDRCDVDASCQGVAGRVVSYVHVKHVRSLSDSSSGSAFSIGLAFVYEVLYSCAIVDADGMECRKYVAPGSCKINRCPHMLVFNAARSLVVPDIHLACVKR